MTLVDRFLAEQDPEGDVAGSTPARVSAARQAGWVSGAGAGFPQAHDFDSAHEDLQRAYEETVDPMFDRYDEEDWF